MRAAGLEGISIEARFVLGAAARLGTDAIRANFVQTRAELIAAELVAAEEVDRAVGLLDNAEFLPIFLAVEKLLDRDFFELDFHRFLRIRTRLNTLTPFTTPDAFKS